MTHSSFFRLLAAALGLLLLGLGVAACSSENRSLLGRTYDNVVARDNAYFLAREKMRATEEALYKARVNDYNHVLALFPTLDEATIARITPDMDDIIKKASLPIQHRPGSDWTDDAYLLIGKARFYKMELEDAVKTFKFVNTTSTDLSARHEALIWLMRTFVTMKEYESAAAVSSILDKEEGTPLNAKDLFLARAQYYLATDEPQKAIANLERAIPLIEPKNERSRTRYVLAQLYQEAGEDTKAYAELNQILKRNPPYELDFFSKLMLGQVSDLNQNDRTRLDKYFAKLLKDPNNKEYRDKIYYEMARLNYRQQRYPDALTLLQQSARVQSPNKSQQAYTYLLAGRIYYDNLEKYRLAAAYYDSAVQSMPRESPEYVATAERSEILQQFAQQLTTIETQDSLQQLARLAPDDLTAQLTTYAQAELLARQQEAERLAAQQAREASRLQTATGISPERSGNVGTDPELFASTSTGAAWYFDNPTAMSTARADFIRTWGDRPLQDNWRIVTQASNSPVTNQAGGVPVSIAGNSSTVVNGTELNAQPNADPAAQLQSLVAQYRQTVPLTAPQLQASQQQVEEALFTLGGIYNQQLHEPARAIETYEQLLTRFPATQHAPETYYSLYLLYKDANNPKAETYAQRLRAQFPTSSYARLVADPEYLRRTSIANEKIGVLLDSAFALYKKQEFPQAATVLAAAHQQYPETDLNDRVAFLSTLLTVRTQPPLTAKAAVEKFYKDYPESPLASQAATLLQSYQKYEAGQLPGALASTQKPEVSAFRPGEIDTRSRAFYRATASPKATSGPPVGSAPPARPSPAPTAAASPAPASSAPANLPPASTDKATAPAPGTTPPPTAPVGAAASPTPPEAPAASTTPATSTTPAATPYVAAATMPHVVAVVFPKGSSPIPDMPKLLDAYNSRFYRVKNLTVQPQSLSDAQDMVLVQALPNVKEAQSYALKLRGPQSPLSRLRGAGYQTVVISIDNLPLLLQSKKVEEYQQFYDTTYR